MRAAQRHRPVALVRPASGAARVDHAVARAPQRHRRHRRLGRLIELERRIVHRPAGHEMIGAPCVVGVRIARERRAHRDHPRNPLRLAAGDLAREQSAKAPADQRDRSAMHARHPLDLAQQPGKVFGRRPQIEAQPPVFDQVACLLERIAHRPHPARVRKEAGKQHDRLRPHRRGIGGRGTPPGRKFSNFAEQQPRRRPAHTKRSGHPCETGAAQQFGQPSARFMGQVCQSGSDEAPNLAVHDELPPFTIETAQFSHRCEPVTFFPRASRNCNNGMERLNSRFKTRNSNRGSCAKSALAAWSCA